MGYVEGIGWIDDGEGGSGSDGSYPPTSASQSPYAWNQTYQQPTPVPSVYTPPDADPYAYNQTYAQTPAYQQPTVAGFYGQESQPDPFSYTQPVQQQQQPDWNSIFDQVGNAFQTAASNSQPQVPSFDANPETPFSIGDYRQPQQSQSFQSDGSPSSMYEQESQQPDWFAAPTKPLTKANPFNLDTSADTSLTPYPANSSGASFSDNPETPFTQSDYTAAKPYVPTRQQEMTKPPLPYQEGYDPRVGSQLDPSKIMDRASQQTLNATDPFNEALTTLGAPFAAAGSVVAGAAGANIPVISPVAQAGQWFQQQVVSPAANLFTSTVGALSRDGNVLDTLHGAGPAGYLIGGAADVLQGRDPTQYYKDVVGQLPATRFIQGMDINSQAQLEQYRQQQAQETYDSQIASGATPDVAQKAAQRIYSFLANPVNMAEYPGSQQFGQLPAAAQLGYALIDPVGNRVIGAEVKPLTQGLPSLIKKTAEKTGAAQVIDSVLENTVRAPEQRAFRFGQVADRVVTSLDTAAESVGKTAADVLPDFLFNVASPLYHEKVIPNFERDARAQETIDRVQQAYKAAPEYKPGGSDNPTPAQSQMAQNMQDTGQRPAPKPVDPNAPVATPATTPPTAEPPKYTTSPHYDYIDPAGGNSTYSQGYALDQKGNPDSSSSRAAISFATVQVSSPIARAIKSGIPMPDWALKAQGDFEGIVKATDFTSPDSVRSYLQSEKTYNDSNQKWLKEEWPKYKFDPNASVTTPPAAESIDPKVVAQNAASQDEFNAITANRPATPAAPPEPVALPDRYNAVKLPYKDTGDASEFFNAAKTMQAVDVKALRPVEGAKTPTLRPAKPLEEWGALGAAIRGVNRHTTVPLSRVYLESLSRAVRDPASNLIKYGVTDPQGVASMVLGKFGIGNANAMISRFEQIAGKAEEMGPASMTGDLGGKRSDAGMANLLYHVANPFNEISKDILVGVTRGKYGKSYSDFIEKNEASIKKFMYMREFLKTYDDLVAQGPKTEFFKKNPELYRAVQSGKMTVDQLNDVIRGRVFNGFDMNDLVNNRYNPAMPSDAYKQAAPGVAEGTAGTYGKIIHDAIGSLADRVKAENARRLDAARKTSGYYRTQNPAKKAFADKNAQANAKLIRMEDLDSNHPIVQQMVSDALDAFDANRITLFPQDNALYDFSDLLTAAAANYAADSRRFDLFTKAFNDAIATREAKYAMQFKAPQTDFARMMDLKDKYEATAGLTPQEIRQLPPEQRLTPKQTKEYEAMRDSVALPQQAANAGVELPDGNVLPPSNLPAPDYAAMADQIFNPPAVRINVGQARGGKTMGQVLTPDTMRGMAGKFNRTETVNARGDTFNKATSREQINRWFQDFVATDQYYRKISDNTFKLDPEILAPVRISDGASYHELIGLERPAKIGPNVPNLADAAKTAGYDMSDVTVEQLGDLMKTAYGEKAMQDWAEMDPTERNAIQQEVSRVILGVDPLNPLTNPKGSAEHAKATEMLQKYLDDMDSRKADYASRVAKGEDLTGQLALDMKQVTDSLMAERFNATYAAKSAAYDKVKGTYFDYRDKNRIDQVLGTVLPFQYWARQNFAYLARYFAANPYHFAALLNFYQNVEKANSDPTIPGYAKFSMEMARVGNQHLMYDPTSIIPFNPVGNSDTFGGLTLMSNDDLANANVANDQPLGIFNPGQFLFGKDKKNAQGKVTGRDKGVLSSWLSPNPAIKDFLQTGIFNKWLGNMGLLAGDQTTLGQDYPEDTRGQHARAGLIPAAAQYRDLGAVTGATKALRDAGVIKGDLDIEGPLNEALYGKNAGKQQTAIFQELASMAQKGEITADEGKLAVAAYKDGSYNSKALLAALDRVDADQAGLRLASMVGFSAQLFNTPRQQTTNQIYADENKAYAANPAGYRLDENGNAVANTSATSKFYKDNAGANVLSQTQSTDTPETIKKSIADDKTYDAINALKAQRKDGTLDYPTYTAELNKLQGENPVFFKNNPYYAVTPGEAKYENLVDQYKAIGGQNFDDMQAKAFAAKDKGDEDGYKKIVSSQAYKTASNERLDFLLANPDFQKQYTANNDQYARGRTQELLGGLGRSNPQLAPKPQKTLEDLQYTKTTNQYYDIGGDNFDKLQQKAYAAKDNGDDATFKKIVASPDYQAAQKQRNDFIISNPDWYKQYSDYQVSKGGAGQYSGPLPPTAKDAQKLQPTVSNLLPNAPKTIPDIQYAQQLSEYYAKGGADYDKLVAQQKAYFDSGNDSKAYDIINSRDYQRVQSTLDQFKLDNPDFAKRYDKEYTAKYGKPPKSDDEKVYDQQRATFYNIGGARYDQLSKQVSDLFDAKDTTAAYAIENSREFKAMQASRDQYLLDNPDFATRYNQDYTAKYGKAPTTDAEKEYNDLKGQYADIGGAKYDALAALANQYYTDKNTTAYKAIVNSKDYTQAKAARAQFLADHPDFATQYNAENAAKYGTTTSNTSSAANAKSNSANGSGSSNKYSSGYTAKSTGAGSTKSASAPLVGAQKAVYAQAINSGMTSSQAYAKAIATKSTSTTSTAKNYNTQNRSNTTNTTTAKNKTVTSAAGGYTNPFKLPLTDPKNPFFIPGKTPATPTRTSFNGTAYPAKGSATTPTAAPKTGGTSASTWDANQRKAYAQEIAKGKTKAYAAKVANSYYAKKPWQA